MKNPDILEAIIPVANAFEKLGIAYYIGGSVASSAYGFPRSTMDEDQINIEFYLVSPEDIILNKLMWFRLGGGVSDRQWKDVLGVLKVQKNLLDKEYLQHWASELKVKDLLDKAFSQAGINN